jgi:hypothetical protein
MSLRGLPVAKDSNAADGRAVEEDSREIGSENKFASNNNVL